MLQKQLETFRAVCNCHHPRFLSLSSALRTPASRVDCGPLFQICRIDELDCFFKLEQPLDNIRFVKEASFDQRTPRNVILDHHFGSVLVQKLQSIDVSHVDCPIEHRAAIFVL